MKIVMCNELPPTTFTKYTCFVMNRARLTWTIARVAPTALPARHTPAQPLLNTPFTAPQIPPMESAPSALLPLTALLAAFCKNG